jgi:hypothetical protein
MATAAPKLDIKKVLAAVDRKDYDFYDNLTPEEQKAFSPYMLMRYTSNVQGDRDTQEWFIEMTNEMVNKNHFDLSKDHKALLWKLYAATGAGISCYHPYLAEGKKDKAHKIEKLLCELHPAMKMSDIKLLASMMDKKDCEELFDKMGFDKKQRKEYE